MVASSAGCEIDRLNLPEAAETSFPGDGVPSIQTNRDSIAAVKSPETSVPNSPRSPRDSGTIVRLFPTPPQIFGITQTQQQTQQLERDNARQVDTTEAPEGSELRPLEAEALTLSRMLKSLQPVESTFPGFPTLAVAAEPVTPAPPTHSRRSSQDRYSGELQQGVGLDANGVLEGQVGSLSDRVLRLGIKDRNSGRFVKERSESFGSGRSTNSNLPPQPKSTKSRSRRSYGISYSSRGSTPNSSIGSASELQFPTVELRSPPSPEPLAAPRPGSPLKWRPKNSSVSPVEESNITMNKSQQETPVQGLIVDRNISISDFNFNLGTMTGKALFQDVQKKPLANQLPVPAEPEPSDVVRRLKATYIDVGEEQLLRSMIPSGTSALDANGKDYSIALEYQGPPVGSSVLKVEPLHVSSAVRSPSESLPVVTTANSQASDIERAKSASWARSSLNTVNPFPSWFGNDRDKSKQGDSPSTSALVLEGRDENGTHSLPLSPRSRYPLGTNSVPLSPRLRTAAPRELERTTPDESRRFSDQLDQAEMSTTSLERGSAQPSTRTLEGASDNESESASKLVSPSDSGLSVSRSFRSYVSESILAKSEPMGLWKLKNSVDYSGDSVGMHKSRSMSLPGPKASGSQANANHLTPKSRVNGSSVPRRQQRRKGECYRCYKGSWLTERECCLVCNSKYCQNCVLTAMESMPEGRKCKTCIGKPVYESRRLDIGKPSRLLNRLLGPQEVQQIMKAEKECAANQLRPEQVYINSRQLTAEELALLLNAPNPPQKLKPGRYWYDLQSGLWGKEGGRPDKLISPDLKVGGPLQENASNGNTQVFMNGRELSKLEVQMLKLAGVHCPPSTHLWVEPDGSYQEEGHNIMKGNIWNKTSIRLLYPFFSLPTPGSSKRYSERESPNVYMPDSSVQNRVQKLLVLGHEGSGRSTLFKQSKYLFKDGFCREERLQMKLVIQHNIYKYIGILLEGRERFEEEEDDMEDNNRGYATEDYSDDAIGTKPNLYALDGQVKDQAESFSEMLAEGASDVFMSSTSNEYPILVDNLWRHPAIVATHRRKDELNTLPDGVEHFLDKVTEIFSKEYIPSDDDILKAEGLAQGSGLAEVKFTLDDKIPFSYQDHGETAPPGRYQLIKVEGKGKLLDMFEDVHAIVFCVALSEYDQVSIDSKGVPYSKLRQKELFESVLKHPILGQKPMVLLLNKYDLFEGKICKGIELTTSEWFSDFRPVGASHMTAQMQAQLGYTYIVHKYKELFQCSGHRLFTFKLNALERDNVLRAFQFVREILNPWYLLPEESSYTSDYSSYSQQFNTSAPGQDGL